MLHPVAELLQLRGSVFSPIDISFLYQITIGGVIYEI